jgi:EF-P beta-lysylation protein EpmB
MGIVSTANQSVRTTTPPWQTAIQTAVRSGAELCRRLKLNSACELAATAAERDFPVFAPLGFIARMRPGDPHDPLLRQVLPVGDELTRQEDATTDPVGDNQAQRSPGLIQKYEGRVLLITTGACAVHCRYCFRRHYPYHAGPALDARWNAAVQYIGADPAIEEVILSGGDPLTIADSRLARLAGELAGIPHVQRLRIHTRLPIVIPERVTKELIDWLNGTRLTPLVVVHANHPRELDASVGASLMQMVRAGIPVLNQAVLLRGVNDEVQTLVELSRRLLDYRVLPYYLHQLDRVIGAAHFEVPVTRGRELIAALRARLPGYAVPRYVQEIPGTESKIGLD